MMNALAAKFCPADPIRTHVEMLHGLAKDIDGVLVVSVFNADLQNDRGTITHHKPGDVDCMIAAIEAHSETPGANVYVGLQVMRRGLQRGQRGTEADIVAVLGLVADMDGDTGKNAGEYPVPPNYMLETSPGNLQPFWLFDRPVKPAEAKAIARGLKIATGADHGTADITHVWRVPGTKNWPNKTKLDRGRSADPASVIVSAPWDGSLTDPFALLSAVGNNNVASAVQPIALSELPDIDGITVSPRAAALLVADNVDDRSGHANRVAEQLAFDGHSAEEAAALFLSATGNWLDRYPTEASARKDFARMWGKEPCARHAVTVTTGAKLAAGLKPANDNRPAATYPGIQSSGEFIRGFTPPDYHLDGVSQKGFLYSTTAMTGTGKTAVLLLLAALTMLGKPLGDREIEKGRVVYFAGENPDDVRMRWIAMSHHLDFDPDCVDVHFIAGAFGVAEMFERIKTDVETIGGADMIVVDTSAAYFNGDDENSNTQLGAHARNLRALTTLSGKPVVYAACHPVKNPDPSNLLPRGGGAFIAEVDGNLTLNKGETVKLHWQGKHRGPDFDPIHFELKTVTVPSLVDSKGRPVPTVMAEALTKVETAKRADKARSDDDDVLLAIDQSKGASLAELAESVHWHMPNGDPDKGRVRRAKDRLYKKKLVDVARKGWVLTKKGHDAAMEARADKHEAEARTKLAASLIRAHDG
jgi:hypothetical protein